MSKSFGQVEKKTLEAEFFFNKFKDAYRSNALFESECYFNSFIASSRSITMTIQYCLKKADGFEIWYSNQQKKLKNCELAKLFLELRNRSVHRGENFAFSLVWNEKDNGHHYLESWFSPLNGFKLFPSKTSEDILSSSKEYFCLLLGIVQACYVDFGKIIDPDQYWSFDNIASKNWTCEDIEQMLGFPRGWTKVTGQSEETRMEFLIQQARSSNSVYCPLEPLFEKYLNVNKYGIEYNTND